MAGMLLGGFIDQIENDLRPRIAQGSRIIFRGIADPSFRLQTSLGRTIIQSVSAARRTFDDFIVWMRNKLGNPDIVNVLLERFVRQLPIEFQRLRHQFEDRPSDHAWWQFGRHFKLDANTLDWTTDPYVALFFAITGMASGETRCVVFEMPVPRGMVDREQNFGRNFHFYPDQSVEKRWPYCLSIYDPLGLIGGTIRDPERPLLGSNRRVANQRGVFTYCSKIDLDIEDYYESGEFDIEYGSALRLIRHEIEIPSPTLALRRLRDRLPGPLFPRIPSTFREGFHFDDLFLERIAERCNRALQEDLRRFLQATDFDPAL